jgi:hypothetical protein
MTQRPQKRLRFDGVEQHTESGKNEVRVLFSFGEKLIRTSSPADDNPAGILKAAAEASLKAIEEACNGKFSCSLADLDHVNALGKDLVAVLVNVTFEAKQVQVFGSCQISGNELETAVRATLNATNRLFELALRG